MTVLEVQGMMHKKMTLADLKRVARKAYQNGGFIRKEVKISTKDDITDRVEKKVEKLLQKWGYK